MKFFDYDEATQARMEELTRALLDSEQLPANNQAAYEASQARIIAAEKALTPVQRFIARDRSR